VFWFSYGHWAVVSQHLTAMSVICCYSVGQKNLYGNLLNRSNHNKVLVQKLLFYLVAFEFLAKVSNIYTAFSCNDIESRFFNTWNLHNIITKLFRKPKCVFTNFLKKAQCLTHNLATDKLKNLSKNHKKKQVCKMSAKSLHIQQQVCKNKKASL